MLLDSLSSPLIVKSSFFQHEALPRYEVPAGHVDSEAAVRQRFYGARGWDSAEASGSLWQCFHDG